VTPEVAGTETQFAEFINRTLLLVTREATRNAMMHAGPTSVTVRLLFARERLAQIGGSLEVTSALGVGPPSLPAYPLEMRWRAA
jgi:signal transduction histidine kinase